MSEAIHLFRPYINFKAVSKELEKIFESGWIGLGPKTQEFEEKFAEFVGAKYAIAVNSCTAALHLSLEAYGLRDGKVIATTPISFVSTNHVILYQNCTPMFFDVGERDLCIDPDKISPFIDKIDAIMVVHYAGNPASGIEKIYDMAANRNIPVIEDCAHAAGARYRNGEFVGTCPYKKSISCFSFHAVKNLPIGDGGVITTNDERIYERLKRLRWLGIDKDTFVRATNSDNKGYNWLYDVPEIGYKYHMNDISAVIGLESLKNLDHSNLHRRKLFGCYQELLAPPAYILPVHKYNSSHHLIVLVIPEDADREKLVEHMNRNNIYPGVHYTPNHFYSMYNEFVDELPVAEKMWKRIVSLPNHLHLERQHIQRVCKVVNEFFA